jgi:hypothetical protein
LLRKWPRNALDIENDAYETLELAYNKKLNLLVLVSIIIKSNVEEDSSPPFPKDIVMDSKKETTNSKNTTPIATP